MIYIVHDEDPKPEQYVAIFVRQREVEGEFKRTKVLRTFPSEESAIEFANTLKSKFRVPGIRLFYEEGHSKTLRN